MTHLSIFSQQYSLNNSAFLQQQTDDLQINKQQSSFHLNSRKSSFDLFSNNQLSIPTLQQQQQKNDEYDIDQFMNNYDMDVNSADLLKNDSLSSSDKVSNPLNQKNSQQQDFLSAFTLSNKVNFQPYGMQQQQQANINSGALMGKSSSKQIFKIQKSSISKKTKISKNYDKNICRYLTRKTIRCFAKNEYKQQGLIFANGDENLWFDATDYFLRKIEQITGFRVLKEYLNYSQEQDATIKSYKMVFKQFYIWFLKNRISRYILNGSMENKSMYLKYKNEVMLSYYESLDDWTSNKNQKILKRKIQKK